MERIEQILTNCIKDIRSGKSTIDECLNRHASIRKNLEPLLKVALSIQDPNVIDLNTHDKQATRERLLQQIKTTRQKRSRSFTDIFSFGIPPQYVWARVLASVVTVVIVVSMLGGGTAYASQSSLPGEVLYPVKTGTEDVRLFFAGDSSAKTELNVEFAAKRLEELSKVANKNEKNTTLAVDGYRHNLNAVNQQLKSVSATPELFSLVDSVLNEIQSQISTCDSLVDVSPVYMKPVTEASALAVNSQVDTLKIMLRLDTLRATEVNINAMQNRLQRALNTSTTGKYQIMEQVLLQYQQLNQLGQQILQSAQATNDQVTPIEDLILQSQSSYLVTLQNLSQQAPQEYRNTIETCTQMTKQLQERARYGQRGQGNNSFGPGESPVESSSDSTQPQDGQTNTQPQEGTGNSGDTTPVPATSLPGPGGDSGSGSGNGTGTPGGTGSGEGGQGGMTPIPGHP